MGSRFAIAGGGNAASTPPSCQDATALCRGESCCKTITLNGGTFKMGRSTDSTASDYYNLNPGAAETPEHDAIVRPFGLDKYEVTVGRFRKFLDQYEAWRVTLTVGAGAIKSAAGTGWGQSWALVGSELSPIATLKTDISRWVDCNWTEVPAGIETYPINAVNWYEAFAFCLWDGGRLPTEAEWEFAAAGGAENRRYPWGPDDPTDAIANFSPTGSPKVAVGSDPAGVGGLRAASRTGGKPDFRQANLGFSCARDF